MARKPLGKPPDLLLTVRDGNLLLSPITERAELWLNEYLPEFTQIGDTILVAPEFIDAAVDDLVASDLRVVTWQTRVVEWQRVPNPVEALLRYVDSKKKVERSSHENRNRDYANRH